MAGLASKMIDAETSMRVPGDGHGSVSAAAAPGARDAKETALRTLRFRPLIGPGAGDRSDALHGQPSAFSLQAPSREDYCAGGE
jgi:hypothetical protein